MTIHLTAEGLRRAADVLDKLAEIEAATGVQFDGAYNGHVMLSAPDRLGGTDATEPLRLVRRAGDHPSPNVVVAPVYALEFEVP